MHCVKAQLAVTLLARAGSKKPFAALYLFMPVQIGCSDGNGKRHSKPNVMKVGKKMGKMGVFVNPAVASKLRLPLGLFARA
jgi:hypothetical protein